MSLNLNFKVAVANPGSGISSTIPLVGRSLVPVSVRMIAVARAIIWKGVELQQRRIWSSRFKKISGFKLERGGFGNIWRVMHMLGIAMNR